MMERASISAVQSLHRGRAQVHVWLGNVLLRGNAKLGALADELGTRYVRRHVSVGVRSACLPLSRVRVSSSRSGNLRRAVDGARV